MHQSVCRHLSWALVVGLLLSTAGCSDEHLPSTASKPTAADISVFETFELSDDALDTGTVATCGALVGTRFESYEQLNDVLEIEHLSAEDQRGIGLFKRDKVVISHACNGLEIRSVLARGISQLDYLAARDSGMVYQLYLGLASFFATATTSDLRMVYYLARRKPKLFGEGDVAFFDIAEHMAANIDSAQLAGFGSKDTTEKGFINTFNHITAQAIITSIFSERIADFVADVHERQKPELITGKFTQAQLDDLLEGPVDNYVDIINNEWGQELGKHLKEKYEISRKTEWTPELLCNYLNDNQRYYSWSLGIRFKPFEPTDNLIQRYHAKINSILSESVDFEY